MNASLDTHVNNLPNKTDNQNCKHFFKCKGCKDDVEWCKNVKNVENARKYVRNARKYMTTVIAISNKKNH